MAARGLNHLLVFAAFFLALRIGITGLGNGRSAILAVCVQVAAQVAAGTSGIVGTWLLDPSTYLLSAATLPVVAAYVSHHLFEGLERDKGLFDDVSEMRTEDLSKTQNVARCAELLGPGFIADVPPVHVHQTVQFDLKGMSLDDLRTIEEVWEQLDYVRAIRDQSYPLRFFFDATMRLRERDPVQAEPVLRELAPRLARVALEERL